MWLIALDPAIGREIKKTRPGVVISPNELNKSLETVIVAPMSTRSLPAPYRVPVAFGGKRGLILLEQLRAVDNQRLVRRVGRLSGKAVTAALNVLQEMFAD